MGIVIDTVGDSPISCSFCVRHIYPGDKNRRHKNAKGEVLVFAA